MKKFEVVKSHEDFNEILNKGKKIGNKYFLIFRMPQEQKRPCFGIALGKKIGNAVVRNKFKRQMRSIIDHNKFLFENNAKYIIMVKRECLGISFQDMEKILVNLLRKEKDEK